MGAKVLLVFILKKDWITIGSGTGSPPAPQKTKQKNLPILSVL